MSTPSAWNVHGLPPQNGRTYLVTGSTAGIGYFVAEQLAGTGATVVLGARDAGKAQLAMTAIRAHVPDARLRHLDLDLSSLGSIRTAALTLDQAGDLDGIVLNAGVLAQRQRRQTADGHELVYGTNHLGHFALAAQLYPALARTPGSRIVTVGSIAARMATLDLDDLETVQEPYRGFKVYARSKLAQMTFAIELDQRLRASGSPVISLLAHPGGALDGLTPPRPPLFERTGDQRRRALLQVPVAQSKEHAAWPAVRATLDPRAQGGQLWGPRFLRSRGKPALETVPAKMRNTDATRRLWRATEDATGITWPSTEAARNRLP